MSESQYSAGRLTDEDLREFIAIYKQSFGEELSIAQARGIALPLVELYAQLARPLPSEIAAWKPKEQEERM